MAVTRLFGTAASIPSSIWFILVAFTGVPDVTEVTISIVASVATSPSEDWDILYLIGVLAGTSSTHVVFVYAISHIS
jgi:uncharacterized membrane protein YuzA (DUF378 family)